MLSLKDFLAELKSTDQGSDIWKLAMRFLRDRGITMVGYLHIPPHSAPDAMRITTTGTGYPEEWAKKYIDERLYDVDPIPATALKQAEAFRWSEIGERTNLTRDQKEFLASLNHEAFADGLAIPVFGPAGRNGYVGLAFGSQDVANANGERIHELQWMAQATHVKYCTIVQARQPEEAPLSTREREVLQWVARGKSNSDISAITGISSNTVDTYLRRIYQKLNVSDRVTAAVRGIGTGFIKV